MGNTVVFLLQHITQQDLEIHGLEECGPQRYRVFDWIQKDLRYMDFGQKPCRYIFFEKKIPLVHRCNLTKRGFEQHGFFLEPKTAHLEALPVRPRATQP